MLKLLKKIVKSIFIIDNNIRYEDDEIMSNHNPEEIKLNELSDLLVDILDNLDDEQEVFLEMIDDMMEDDYGKEIRKNKQS